MPTAAKLIAAFALGLAAYAVANVAHFRSELLQETGINTLGIAFVASLVGWSRLGPAAERSYGDAVAGGMGAAFIAYVFVVFSSACMHVLAAIQYHAYKDVDAMLDGFVKKAMEYAFYMGDWPVFVATIAGGALAGIFSGFAGRLWT